MGNLTKGILFTATLIGGYYLGDKLVQNNTETSQYEIIQQEKNNYLRSKEQNKAYILNEINNEIYMGDLEHLLNGVIDLSNNKEQTIIEQIGDKYE